MGEAALPLVDTLSSSRSLLSTSGLGLPLPPSDLDQSSKERAKNQRNRLFFSNVAQVEREELRLCGKNLKRPKKEVDLYEMLFALF